MTDIIFFDLDNTICPVNMPASGKTNELLHKLDKKNIRLAVISGKPVSYLNGFARQIGLRNLIMIGENGITYQFGSDLPPKMSGTINLSEEDAAALRKLKDGFDREFHGKCWYQKNEYAFTAFPFDSGYFDEMDEFFERETANTGIFAYRHIDCFDALPYKTNKGIALEYICNLLKIKPENAAAVGDTINDYPMFEKAGISVGINLKDKSKAKVNTCTVEEALEYLLNMTGERL